MADRPPPLVVCVGIAVRDLVFRVERFPQGPTKSRASAFETIGGGNAANAAVAIARLGGRVRLASCLGDDEDGDWLLDGLAREGVDVSAVVRRDGATSPVSSILIDAAGERQIVTRRDRTLDHALPTETVAALLDGAAAVLADSRFPLMGTPMLAEAKRLGLVAMLDGDRATAPDDPVLRACTHAVFSAEALRETTGEDDLPEALTSLTRATDALVAVTDGEHGVQWIGPEGWRHLPAFRVAVVDTLGAGDVFHGAATLGLAEGMDIAAAFRFGAAAAALKCANGHGRDGAPTRATLDAFLSGRR